MGDDVDDDSDNNIGRFGCGDRNDRGDLLVAWLHGHRLAALSTFFELPRQELWTQVV